MADPLDGHNYLSLGTFRKDGRMVETPVWFAADGGSLWAFTLRESGKVKRLRNSPRSRIAACDVRGRLLGKWIDAETLLVDDPAVELRAYRELRRKYGWQMRIGDLMSRLSGRIKRRIVLEIRPLLPAA